MARSIERFVESLQSHCIHTQSHWSSGSTRCFPLWGTRVQYPGGYLCETGILICDPDVIDHCGLVWGRLRPELSLGRRADNVITPFDLTQLFCPSFTLAAGPPSSFTTDIVGCWGVALWRAFNLTAFTQSLTGSGSTLYFPAWGTHFQSLGGYLCETRILLLALSRYRLLICWNWLLTFLNVVSL